MADKSRKGLGKGLDSIFGTNVEQFLDDIQNNGKEVPGRREIEIAIDEIRANPYQPRKEFDEKALQDLSNSIKVHGIFTPLLVRKSQAKGYELIAGERRLRAAKLAGLTVVPAISVEFTDEEMMEISILENVQREDLNPVEVAKGIKKLMDEFELTQEKVAERLGKARSAVANSLRILSLYPEVLDLVEKGKVSFGHAKILASIEDYATQLILAKKVAKDKLTVRDLEKEVNLILGGKKKVNKSKLPSEELQDFVSELQRKLGTKVSLIGNDKKGRIYIDYYSQDDLDRIYDIVLR